jgi:hypothetical protein
MEYYITGCSECPFYYFDDNERYGVYSVCHHPSQPKDERGRLKTIEISSTATPITPDWCPLKTEHCTIALKQPTQ